MDYFYFTQIREIFWKTGYLPIFLALLAIFAILFGVTSNIVVIVPSALVFTSILQINPFVELPKIGLSAIIAVLMALNSTVLLHNYRNSYGKNQIGNAKTGTGTDTKTTFLGGFIAMFATACPVCQPIWLVWLGFGSVSAFLADVSIYVALLSLSLLFVSLHYSLRSISNVCEVNSNGKKPEDNRHALQIMRDAAD